MRINQNISALNTHSRLTAANNAKSSSLAKLSSGLRINKAGDDAAGLAISEKMRGQVGGLKQSIRNAQDGISLIQTAEGALSETHSMLNRMRDLAVQASNDTNTDADRLEIQKEIEQLTSEVSRVANNTEFNTMTLLNGNETTKELSFHIGANGGQNIKVEMGDMRGEALGIQKADKTIAAGDIADTTFLEKDTIVVKEDIAAVTTSGSESDAYTEGQVLTKAEFDALDDNNKAALTGKTLEVKESGHYNDTDYTLALASDKELKADDVLTGKSSLDLTTQAGADSAISVIDAAVSKVSEERSKLGSVQNRLDHTINNLTATRKTYQQQKQGSEMLIWQKR